MKKGSGDDPFADLDTDADDESADDHGSADDDEFVDDGDGGDEQVEPRGSDAQDSTAPARDASTTEHTPSSTKERYTERSGGATDTSGTGTDRSSTGTGRSQSESDAGGGPVDDADGQTKAEADGIPWVLRRSRVKEDRENVHQFFLREEYSAREDEIIEAVASDLELRQKDIQKLDVREAMVAAADPADIAEVLRDWGYEYID